MDFERARFNMIEQQIRPWEVLDQRVLDILMETPREAFVPDRYRNLALADINIPLGHGEVMMQPKVEGRLLQALAPQPDDRILEIGTGSGYVSACMAHMADHVFSVEIHTDLAEAATNRLRDNAVHNVTVDTGDGSHGWSRHAPYDAIAVTGALGEMHYAFHRQLRIGGRLFMIVGRPPAMEALLITRMADEAWSSESLFETVLPWLINAEARPRFEF